MEYFLIPVVTLLASILTFFSGFGLGTILLPVLVIFFPISVSIALTAVVHLLNNLFKLAVMSKYAKKLIVIKFGLPALVSAFVGALALNVLSKTSLTMSYTLFGNELVTSPLKILVGLLIIFFAIFELLPTNAIFLFKEKYLPVAGILSGFFGGLSGHQGALRSAFLIKCDLTKESFIGTGVVIACLVDVARIIGYGCSFGKQVLSDNVLLLLLCAVFALTGVGIDNKLIRKVTLGSVQTIISTLLILIGLFLTAGII